MKRDRQRGRGTTRETDGEAGIYIDKLYQRETKTHIDTEI